VNASLWNPQVIKIVVGNNSTFLLFFYDGARLYLYDLCPLIKVKLKFTVEQATKAQRGSRDTAVLFI